MTNKPDPVRDFIPRQNEIKINAHPTETPITNALAISLLEDTPDKHKALVERLLRQCASIPCMTDEEIDRAHMDVLAAKGIKGDINAIRERWDRVRGKSPQSVNMTVEDKGLGKLETEKLLRLAAMLEEPVVIGPMPHKLGEDGQ